MEISCPGKLPGGGGYLGQVLLGMGKCHCDFKNGIQCEPNVNY